MRAVPRGTMRFLWLVTNKSGRRRMAAILSSMVRYRCGRGNQVRKRGHKATFLLRRSNTASIAGTYTRANCNIYITDSVNCCVIVTKIKHRTSKWRATEPDGSHWHATQLCRTLKGELGSLCQIVWLLDFPKLCGLSGIRCWCPVQSNIEDKAESRIARTHGVGVRWGAHQ